MTGSSFASSVSTDPDWEVACGTIGQEITKQLQGTADVVMVFLSQHHAPRATSIAERLTSVTGATCLVGCTGESILGAQEEIEGKPALASWAACLPGIDCIPMHLTHEETSDGSSILGWPDTTLDPWPPGSVLLLLADPFSFPTDALVTQLNQKEPGIPVVGGNASGGRAPRENRLLLADQAIPEGAVAVLLRGDTGIRTIVSQGCRPIGNPLVITRAETNVIHELGGKPALLQLKQIFDSLPTREQTLVQQGLHLGRVVSEYQDAFEQGDFLVRNVLGIDPDQGTIAVAELLRPGQTVQFQVRDHHTATADLVQLLEQLKASGDFQPGGGLLFSCNGRGTRLFPEPHHDVTTIANVLGSLPLAGFFAAGEIGPVGKENFIHGFTASLALFPGAR